MIKKALLNFLGLVFCFSVFSQNQTDSIYITKAFGDYKFECNGKRLRFNEVRFMMKDNPEALNYLEKAKHGDNSSRVFSYAGGFLIGYPIGTAIAGGKPKWKLAAVGFGLLVFSIPISNLSRAHAIFAIDKYNGKRKSLSYNIQYDLKLGLSPNGIALVARF